MNEFMKILLSLSVSGTLLLLLILGLKPLYKNRFNKRWQYYIWIVVALRFLLPFTPDTTIVGSLFEKFDTAAITNEVPTSLNVPVPAGTGNRNYDTAVYHYDNHHKDTRTTHAARAYMGESAGAGIPFQGGAAAFVPL